MKTCEFLTRMGAYYDNEVSAGERAELQTHVATCAVCLEELAGLGRLSVQLQSMAWPRVSPQVQERLQYQIQKQKERGLLHTAYSLLALAASLFVVLSLWVQQIGPGSTSQAVPAWELTAANYPTETSVSSNQEVATAQWIFEDLSRRDASE